MTSAAELERQATTTRLARLDYPLLALCFVLITTSVIRVAVLPGRPLWLDEVWTGMIVSQPSFADFVRQIRYDVNGPLYSLIAAVWAQVSGISDQSLRILPAAFGIAAPLIALTPRALIGRSVRFTWCALLACWIPGIWFSWDARPYTLVIALGVANAITFASVLRDPSARRAWSWTIISSLLVLSHYYGAILIFIQGLVYLGIHRRNALKTWPAALAFAPILIAMASQADTIQSFATPGHSWIHLMNPFALFGSASYILGELILVFAFPVWVILAFVFQLAPHGRRDETVDRDNWPLQTAATCAAAAAICAIGLGFLRPMYVPRYLTPFIPGLYLGLALIATRASRYTISATLTLVALFFACAIAWALKPPRAVNTLNWEAASRYLMADSPTRLVFMWDTPLTPPRSSLAGVGGFFFKRAGDPIPVDGVDTLTGVDPNRQLLSHASKPGSAIIWMYDLDIPGTAAIEFPPAISVLDPRWQCEDFGDHKKDGVLACRRAGHS